MTNSLLNDGLCFPHKKHFSIEQWKDIPGYESLYEASDCGRIRTHENKVTSSARFKERHWKQRILKQKYQTRRNGKKDARICLWKDGKEKTFLVSRLVAMTWCEGYLPGLTVNHIDGNPENNKAENLEWVTLKRNIQEGFRTGLFPRKSCVVVEKDGTEKQFASYTDASRYLGKNPGYVSGLIKNNRNVVDGRFVLPF